MQGIAKPLKPKGLGEPNLLVKPRFITFLKKGKLGEPERTELDLS